MGYLDPVDMTIGMVERVGLLEKLLLKVISSPEKAGRSLAEALGEIEKSTTALREALLSVSNISLPEQVTADLTRQLDNLASGPLEISVNKAKGSCSRIGNIHKAYLSGVLSKFVKTKFLNSDEVSALEALFHDLSKSDASFVEIARIISGRVKDVSKKVRCLLDAQDLAHAKTVVSDLRKESLEKAERLNAMLTKMIELQGKFVDKSGLT
ncbi:hypothetical protein MYX77_02630 [Acidobacteriia bacterium AH_259_A11_L15]|nr:hypothetical protein [Acidobacteriia bacterium AH_259_A11_L15]